ncbi:TPA: hypothetical protein ACMDPX_002189 [Vibrio cholerae]
MKNSIIFLGVLCSNMALANTGSDVPPRFEGARKVFDSVSNSVDPAGLCQTFNNLTTQANTWLSEHGYPESTMSKDFCKAIEIETNYPTLKFNDIKDSESWGVVGRWEYWLDEEVDVTEKSALVLLSESVNGKNKARYMLYNLADAALVKQYGQYNYDENIGPNHSEEWASYGLTFTQDPSSHGSDGEIMPTYWYRYTTAQTMLSSTWHGSQFRSFLVDRSNSELSDEVRTAAIDFLRATGQSVDEDNINRALPHFYFQICTKDGDPDARCLPGGVNNTNNFEVPYIYPESDSDGKYTHGTSSTVSVGISAGGEVSGDGPSAGFDMSVEQSFEESYSRDGQVMTLEQHALRNNFGATWTYKLDAKILQGIKGNETLETVGYMEDRLSNANAVLGEETWKNIDLSNQVDWREKITTENCVDDSEREMWFINSYDLARTAVTVGDGATSFSDIIKTYEDGHTNNPQPISTLPRATVIKLHTICKDGFRQAKPGIMN